MIQRYECTACGRLTPVNQGACPVCGSLLSRLPRYFNQFSSETGDALDAALRHIHAPSLESASALLRLMILVEEWLEPDELEKAHHIIRNGKLTPTLIENGEHGIARLVESGLIDESMLSPRQQRALRRAEAQAAAIATLEAALDRGDDIAAVEAWWAALRVGIPCDAELVRRVSAARWRLASIPITPGDKREFTPEALPRSEIAQQHLRDVRERARMARVARLRAAGRVSAFEDGTEDIDWEIISDFERRAKDLAALHSAIERGDPADTARAWCVVRAVWPDAVTDALEQAGTAALRAWGSALHACASRETRS
jgi:hypothetical protein